MTFDNLTINSVIFKEEIPGCTVIHMNRPKVKNALNPELIAELTRAFDHFSKDRATRVIVLKGLPDMFCAGADLSWMKKAAAYSPDQNINDATHLAKLYQVIEISSKPTVAVVEGGSFGGGIGLIAACDMAIAEENTIFSLSEVRLGLIPGVIAPYLVKAMGQRHAQRLSLTAERFSAQEALRIGLVDYLAPTEKMQSMTHDLLAQLMKGSPQAQTSVKQLFRDIVGVKDAEIRRFITTQAIANARASQDGKEGVQAFLDKRPPVWKVQ